MTRDRFLLELREGKFHKIVAPVSEENLTGCFSSFTMDESVLSQHEKTVRCFSLNLRRTVHYMIFCGNTVVLAKVTSHLPVDWNIRHVADMESGTKYCATRKWLLSKRKPITSISSSTSELKRNMYVKASSLAVVRPSVHIMSQVSGVLFTFLTIWAWLLVQRKHWSREKMSFCVLWNGKYILPSIKKRATIILQMRDSDVVPTTVGTSRDILYDGIVVLKGLKDASATCNQVVTHLFLQHRACLFVD